MPGVFEAITFLILSAQAGALGAGILAVVGGWTGALGIGLSIGLSLYSYLNRPKPPAPEDVQSSVRNPIASRQRHYGRVKTSGPWVFAESVQGDFHKIIALGTGELDAIEEFWVDDKIVELNTFGAVQTAPWQKGTGDYNSYLLIQYRLGLPTETAYGIADPSSPFYGQWTPAHRGDGVASLYIRQSAAPQEFISDFFPRLTETHYRIVARTSKLYNPVTGLVAWSDNAADVVRDYMTHADGMRLPESIFATPLAHAGWIEAHNRANRARELKAGGTEPSYRLWGSYILDERPADVLYRMFASCDGRLVPTPDGGFHLSIGDWQEPTVVLDEDAITGFSDLKCGKDITSTANVITATYLSPFHDYQSTEADPWVDDDDIAIRGEIKSDMQFIMAPSHAQCRTLMKLAAYRANPRWVGSFTLNMRGLEAFAEQFVRIRYPLFGIDEVFEVLDFRFNISEDNILTGATIQVQSMPAAAYQWNATTEEGTPPSADETTVDNTIPVPADFTFTMGTVVLSGQTFPIGKVSFTAAPSEALVPEVQYRKGTTGEWQPIAVVRGETTGQTGVLEDGQPYQARMRFVTITGRQGEWTGIVNLTPVTDTVAPGALISFGVAPGIHMGNAVLQAVIGADTHAKRLKLYCRPVGTPLDRVAHLITAPLPVSSSMTLSYPYGDTTRVNAAPDPGYDAPGTYTLTSTGWSVTASQAVKVSAATSSQITEPWPVGGKPTTGQYIRFWVDVAETNGTATMVFVNRTTPGSGGQVSSPNINAVGITYGRVFVTAEQDNHGYTGSFTRTAKLNSHGAFIETAGCIPQGEYVFGAELLNDSGVVGPLSETGTIVIY